MSLLTVETHAFSPESLWNFKFTNYFMNWEIMRVSNQNKTIFVTFNIDDVRLLAIIAWESRAQELEKKFEKHASFERKSRRYLSLSKLQMHTFSQIDFEISSSRVTIETEKTCGLKLWKTIFVALIFEMHTFSQIGFEISSSQVTKETEKTCELKFWSTTFVALIFEIHAF